MPSVEFVDHSERIKALIEKKIRAGLAAAAERLADSYVAGLQRNVAPPHSKVGSVPHAYLGHKPGGFGPLHGYGEINNTAADGFSADQSDYLSSFIHGTGTPEGQKLQALVGFTDSHVTRRQQNYLLYHDQHGRPWVRPIYDRSRQDMVNDFKEAARTEGTT